MHNPAAPAETGQLIRSHEAAEHATHAPPFQAHRILIVNTLMEAAGAQKALLQLGQGLQQRGHDVTVATLYDKGEFVPYFSRRYGLNIVNIDMKRPGETGLVRRFARAAVGPAKLFTLMRRGRFEVLQTFSHFSNVFVPPLGLAAGIPVRVSSQRMTLKGQPAWLLRADQGVANSPLVHKMISVSEQTAAFCMYEQGIHQEKLLTIPNGLNLAEFDTLSSAVDVQAFRRTEAIQREQFVIAVVARLHRQKGHRYLLNAVHRLLPTIPQLRVFLIGEGEARGELRSMIQQLALDQHVHLLGSRRDVPVALEAADLFVLPSLWEGLPNAVLEAMAAARPVVATAVDGTPELVIHGETGFLVPPADPDALADAIAYMVYNPEQRVQMGRRGRDRVRRHFSVEQFVERFEDVYADLLARKNPRKNPRRNR